MDLVKKTLSLMATVILLAFASSGLAQDKPSANMDILREKIRADKKLVVALNMELTESEEKGFWPIYEQYQKDLQKINQRLANLLESYADDVRRKSLSDDKARKLIDEATAVDQAEAGLKST
jgi:Skp family chaperone for outer membrane proteins